MIVLCLCESFETNNFIFVLGYLRVTFCNRLKVLLWEFEGTSHDELVLKNREEVIKLLSLFSLNFGSDKYAVYSTLVWHKRRTDTC
jgi:hypothetical protein